MKLLALLFVLSLLALSVPVFAQEDVDTVILASDANYPDALVATQASKHSGFPLLLTGKDALSDKAKEVLTSLNPGEVVVVGGPAVVSDAVVADLKSRGHKVLRLWGVTRFGTSAEVAKHFWPEGSKRAVVVAGQEVDQAVPDEGDSEVLAEVVSAEAEEEVAPVLLAPEGLTTDVQEALEDLEVEEVDVVGDVEEETEVRIEDELTGLEIRVKEKIRGDKAEIKARLRQKLKTRSIDELLVVAVANFKHRIAAPALKNHRVFLVSSEDQIAELVSFVNDKGITKVKVVGKPDLVEKIVAALPEGLEVKSNAKEAEKADELEAEEVKERLEKVREQHKERKEKLEEKRDRLKAKLKEKAEKLWERLNNLDDKPEGLQALLDEAQALLEQPLEALKKLREAVHLVKRSHFDDVKDDREELAEEVEDETEDLEDAVEDLVEFNKEFADKLKGLTPKEKLKVIEELKLERRERVKAIVEAAGEDTRLEKVKELRKEKKERLEKLRDDIKEKREEKKDNREEKMEEKSEEREKADREDAETTSSSEETHTVEMSSRGFSPQTLTIKKGDTVTFVNTEGTHWPASAMHPTHTVYPESGGCIGSKFDACKDLAEGEEWSFVFEQTGTWKYHDHLSASLTGSIIVEN